MVTAIAAQTEIQAWIRLNRIVQRKLRIIARIRADCGGGTFKRSNSPEPWSHPYAPMA
jgi:hypothetical protein